EAGATKSAIPEGSTGSNIDLGCEAPIRSGGRAATSSISTPTSKNGSVTSSVAFPAGTSSVVDVVGASGWVGGGTASAGDEETATVVVVVASPGGSRISAGADATGDSATRRATEPGSRSTVNSTHT